LKLFTHVHYVSRPITHDFSRSANVAAIVASTIAAMICPSIIYAHHVI